VTYELQPIGLVESPLVDLADAPLQGDEGAPGSWLVFDEAISEALAGLHQGSEIFVLTWLDQARRDVLSVHPRGNPASPKQGVFNTRSPHRPNPIGLHRVSIVAINANKIRVRDLEAIDGTPILDIKPILQPTDR
jgi:tRNA-Thr(GGU) m(6)t(6)A37 methyltransferase TsaA